MEKSKKPMSKDKQMKKLITLVDSECKKKRFTSRAILGIVLQVAIYLSVIIPIIILLIVVRNAILWYSIELGEEAQMGYLISQLPALVALSIAVVSIIVSFPLKFKESTVKELTDWYYKKLEKGVNERDRPYLKALIRMKCSEFDVSPTEVYNDNKSLFEKGALLKKLYESYG